MKIYKAATALVLFAAFAYAQDDEVDGDDEDEDGDDEEDEEPELIDISEMWDELTEDEDFQAWYATAEASDDVLVTEWWGYVEDIVAIVDAAVDAQELYDTDLEDMYDFFEELEDEDFAALETELETAIGAYDTFIESVTGNDDFNAAIAEIMVLALTGDDNGSVPYVAWLQGAGSDDFNAQYMAIMALVLDDTGAPLETFDVDAIMAEVETTFALTDVQAALADTFAQVLIAWNAISGDVETMVTTIEDSVDGIVTAYDDLITDEIHETSNKLIDIVDEVITAVEESEEIQGAKEEASGYMDTLNGWIAQDDWDTVYDETLAEVQGAYDTLKTDLEEGLPERAYETEDEEVPDNAFSFAASAAALLASAAVLSF